ncbi:MAG: Toluene efflux pump outer membrane protein TtgI precursor [Candidatus Accumulibacter sp. BA-94]|nr:MAG: Toluene efflux pump outer membrane protein TtgI precursor [Candidatus Accumulibacter sp. BA-94]
MWNYGLPISMPIFTAGALAGQLQSAEAAQQQALFSYQKAIQEAFREVNDALINQDRTREQLHAQRRQVEALQQYAATARLRYDNGYTSFIEVLDAERSLFSVQLQYTQTQGTEFQAMISLYLAMGGGWVNEADRLMRIGSPARRTTLPQPGNRERASRRALPGAAAPGCNFKGEKHGQEGQSVKESQTEATRPA